MCRRGQGGRLTAGINGAPLSPSIFRFLLCVYVSVRHFVQVGARNKGRSICRGRAPSASSLPSYPVAAEAGRTEQRGSQEHHEVCDGSVNGVFGTYTKMYFTETPFPPPPTSVWSCLQTPLLHMLYASLLFPKPLIDPTCQL